MDERQEGKIFEQITTFSGTKYVKLSDFQVNAHEATSGVSICEQNEAQKILQCSQFYVYIAIIAICIGLFATQFIYM